jgi:putative nucleotidyltransferase with HDIG domain
VLNTPIYRNREIEVYKHGLSIPTKAPIVQEKDSYANMRMILDGTVSALAIAAEKRDPYTSGHQQQVSMIAVAIAGEMGLTRERIYGIRVAAILHDLGKISVPAEILTKPGKLTDIEMLLMRGHCQAGYDILKNIPFEEPVAQFVLQHHERVDGSGYPQKPQPDYFELLTLRSEDKIPALSILVVEDSEVNQLVIVNLLRAHGHQVAVANNGAEALELLEKDSYDLILMDILMPTMDGLETTRRIRKREEGTGHHIPIIALTAHAMYGDREKFLAAGMDDYLAKPVRMEELYQALERAVEGNKGCREYSGIEVLTAKDLFFSVDIGFLDQIKDALTHLHSALTGENLPQVEQWAHKIKDLAYQMDEITIKNLAFKIELGARKGDLGQCWNLWYKIKQEYHYLCSMGS